MATREAIMLPPYLTGDRLVLESVSRRAAHAVRLDDEAILCRVLGKYLMVADPDDYTVAPHVAMDGFWEPWTTLAIARAVGPGLHAVDVGANHGYFALLLGLGAGPSGRVLAIEPNPRLAALAARTLEMNGLAGIADVRCCAAGDRRARIPLVVPAHHAADASLHRKRGSTDAEIDVEILTLDELTREWPRVDFVKIDAEGSEPAIWNGMAATVSRNERITVVLEFKAASYADAPGFLRRIQDAGFTLRSIGEDGSLQIADADALAGEGAERMLFLRRS